MRASLIALALSSLRIYGCPRAPVRTQSRLSFMVGSGAPPTTSSTWGMFVLHSLEQAWRAGMWNTAGLEIRMAHGQELFRMWHSQRTICDRLQFDTGWI